MASYALGPRARPDFWHAVSLIAKLPHELLAPAIAHLPRLLEVHEIAFVLRCSHSHVRQLINDGKLPAVRIGVRAWRVRPADFQAFLDSQLQPALAVQPVPAERRAIRRPRADETPAIIFQHPRDRSSA